MVLRSRLAGAVAGLALLSAFTFQSFMTFRAEASVPILAWQGVRTVQILCVVGPATSPDSRRLQTEVCDEIRKAASEGAPVPVKQLAFGDPALIEPGTVTLLAHGHIQAVGAQRLLVLNIRNFRPGGVHTETFFTAPPRAVPLGASDALAEAISASLDELLPWRQERKPRL